MIWALHGNLGAPTDWDAVESSLGEQLEKVDLWQGPIQSFSSWSYRLNDLTSALDPDPVIMGYSLGGRLAMHCLTGMDSVWEAAVFVSSHPGLENENEKAQRRRLDESWAKRLQMGDHTDFLEAWNAQPVFAEDSPTLFPDTSPEVIADAFETWSLGRQEDLRAQLAACAIPQLWVVGEHDQKFRAIAEDAVSEIPSARLHVIPKCGHRVLLQKPVELAECVRDFLARTRTN